MNKLWNLLEQKINDYSIKKKLILFYILCVLLPLFVTDSVILGVLYGGEMKEQKNEMKNVASAVETELIYAFEEAAEMLNVIYINRSVNEFLEKKYESGLDYYEASREIEERNFYEVGVGTGSTSLVMCADNETIVNGDHFYRLSTIKEEEWCRKLRESDNDIMIQFYYIGDKNPSAFIKRKISVMRRLDYYKDLKCEKMARIDLDYRTMSRKIIDMKYGFPVYICSGERIVFSNTGLSSMKNDFECLTGNEKIGYRKKIEIYDEPIQILIMQPESDIFMLLRQHLSLIFLMLAVNILLPGIMAIVFNRSIVSRLTILNQAFDEVEAESLKAIENVQGKDEIGNLMQNYNRMVYRSRELIKTVYKDKMERQKMDIARQKAELLALHSQINPHFLFNVLEGIRMHSIIKGETETAEMIERLAILERQNVNWKQDVVSIREELMLVDAYLKLQKYRFGDRLSYKIDMQNEVFDYMLPKLTLATFVENACVHGIEKKSVPCWIYIRGYVKEEWLCLEIEDTGVGIEEDEIDILRDKMRNSDIESIRQNEHVGMANACLRLKIMTVDTVKFELESELGVGTFVLIKIPLENLYTHIGKE